MQRRRLGDLGEYASLLEGDPAELQALFQDVLILTTDVFRNPEAFEALRVQVLPQILAQHDGTADPIRVWIAGCSTGEEAYSIAILLLEALEEHDRAMPITIFATDVSETALICGSRRRRSLARPPAALLNQNERRIESPGRSATCASSLGTTSPAIHPSSISI